MVKDGTKIHIVETFTTAPHAEEVGVAESATEKVIVINL
jgi:hypothetical protein